MILVDIEPLLDQMDEYHVITKTDLEEYAKESVATPVECAYVLKQYCSGIGDCNTCVFCENIGCEQERCNIAFGYLPSEWKVTMASCGRVLCD